MPTLNFYKSVYINSLLNEKKNLFQKENLTSHTHTHRKKTIFKILIKQLIWKKTTGIFQIKALNKVKRLFTKQTKKKENENRSWFWQCSASNKVWNKIFTISNLFYYFFLSLIEKKNYFKIFSIPSNQT